MTATESTSENTEAQEIYDEHPLQNTWTFWEHRKTSTRDAGKAYGSNMFELGSFSSAEKFWQYKNALPQLSQLFSTQGTKPMKFTDREVEGYSLFKQGIRPEWEDPANASGSEIFCRQYLEPKALDEMYENLLLGLIGETIDPDDEVCGLRVVDKSSKGKFLYRIELWLRTQDQKKIGEIQKKVDKCCGKMILAEFRSHGGSSSGRKY